jgi:hypothetical protein
MSLVGYRLDVVKDLQEVDITVSPESQRPTIHALRNRRLCGKANESGLRFQRLLLLGIVLKSHELLERMIFAERFDFVPTLGRDLWVLFPPFESRYKEPQRAGLFKEKVPLKAQKTEHGLEGIVQGNFPCNVTSRFSRRLRQGSSGS